jgi:hypothetical protein
VRESVEGKAERYLGERRLTIDVVSADLITATCRSDGVPYSVGWTPRWAGRVHVPRSAAAARICSR